MVRHCSATVTPQPSSRAAHSDTQITLSDRSNELTAAVNGVSATCSVCRQKRKPCPVMMSATLIDIPWPTLKRRSGNADVKTQEKTATTTESTSWHVLRFSGDYAL